MIIDKVLSDSYAGEIKRALLSDYYTANYCKT
jgi:hypothetical protein